MALFKHGNRSTTAGRCIIEGSFAPNGSSAVSAASVKGSGFSVARTSTGLFTLTFDQAYRRLIASGAHLQTAAADDTKAQVGTYNAANKTLQIRCVKPATAAGTGTAALGTATVLLPIENAKSITSDDFSVVADATNTGSGGVLGSDSKPALTRTSTSADISSHLVWAATDVTEIQFPGILLQDRAAGADVTVTINAYRDGTTDPAIKTQVKAFCGKSDTDFGSKTGVITAEGNYTITLDSANIDDTKPLYIAFVPEGNSTDYLVINSCILSYTRATKAVSGVSAVTTGAVADVAADANNRISFTCVFSTSTLD